MMGISWGGFNCLQVAALKPPALKAVISIASTVDRYNDDIHYKNGTPSLRAALLGGDDARLPVALARPGARRRHAGGRCGWSGWRTSPSSWRNGCEHQRRDDFWKHGSICEDFDGFPVPAHGHRRLGRRLSQYADEGRRRPRRPGEGADRPLGAQISAFRLAEAARRFPWRSDRLVEPLAARRGYRRRRPAADARLHSRWPEAGTAAR